MSTSTPAPGSECANCGEPLSGPYCSQCGQHAHGSARSVGVLVHDSVHMMTHADSRFWKTIVTLLFHPGRLTHEYLADHRERYLPPVRLYLILSVIFFALTPDQSLSVNGRAVTREQAADIAAAKSQARKGCEQTDDGSATGAVIKQRCLQALEFKFGEPDTEGHSELCNHAMKPPWLQRAVTDACYRAEQDHGAALLRTFRHNLPRMMFVLLPLVAALMLLLYWRPRHLYVEHLVMLIHTHAAMYLAVSLEFVLGWLATRAHWLGSVASVGGWVLAFYIPWYWYVAMRRTYGQGRRRTVLKLVTIATIYGICLGVATLGALAISFLDQGA